MCGAFAEIDIIAEAGKIPVLDNSQEYVISSHMFEHLPDPISALVEWRRILKNGGIVFMIVPKRDALDSDKKRPVSTFEQVWDAYEKKATVDTWDALYPDEPVARRGHYFVYTPELIKQMVEAVDGDWWELIAEEASDSKVGNGFTLALKLDKPAPDDPRLYVAETDATCDCEEACSCGEAFYTMQEAVADNIRGLIFHPLLLSTA